jgi:large subunit ribosomal protein L11
VAKKQITAVVKIQIPAGKATPAPPVGTALGPHGIQIMDFVKQYNAATEAQIGTIIPVEITVYQDRTFSFVTKTPPTSVLLREAAGVDKGAKTSGKEVVASITDAQLTAIAQQKMVDLNANDLDAAKLQVAGTARSMGITVEG